MADIQDAPVSGVNMWQQMMLQHTKSFVAMGIPVHLLEQEIVAPTASEISSLTEKSQWEWAKQSADQFVAHIMQKFMRPKFCCAAVPGGAIVFGQKFRSLRLARVYFKFSQRQHKTITFEATP